MQKIIYSLATIVLILSCSCCKTSKSNVKNGNYPLKGTKWMLEAIEGEDVGTEFAIRPYIIFDSTSNFTGNLGCNSMFGAYTVNKKQKMTIEYSGSTKRLCQQISVERKFIKALRFDVNRYEIKGDQLILFVDDKEVMRFKGVKQDEVE